MTRTDRQVEAILFRYTGSRTEYALFKRTDARGGFWQPITGGVEEGETLAEAVVRELEEETGITEYKKMLHNIHQFAFGKQQEYVFGIEVDSETTPDLKRNIYPEHEEYRWCTYEEAQRLLTWKGNKEGLEKLHKILEGRI